MSLLNEVRPGCEQIAQFHDEGYFILERAIADTDLVQLRSECDRFMAETDAFMQRRGKEVMDLTHRGKRYFIDGRHTDSPFLGGFLHSDLMAGICQAILGNRAYLFLEGFVVKAAEVGMPLAWHQDSGYVPGPHKPFITCWCALDDMTEENGTVYILPYSRGGRPELIEHAQENGTNDRVGYQGADPGNPIVAPAGSIAVFSSLAFHRSGLNTTNRMRRVYVAQYSSEPVLEDNGKPVGFVEPVIQDGVRVPQETAPTTKVP